MLEQIAPELVALRAKAQETDLAQQQVKVAEQVEAQAELSFQQRENLLKVEREKVKDSAEKTKDLIQTIARREPLAKLQAAFPGSCSSNLSRKTKAYHDRSDEFSVLQINPSSWCLFLAFLPV